MKYLSGQEICINDKVVADDSEGVVVWVFDADRFSEDYPKDWAYLKEGVLVETKKWGLIHYRIADDDLVFLERGIAATLD